ncbi:GDP-mannose pyrophosphatase NudK [Algoriphagus sp. A40]|uniref:GDP-mannose pyrophosphatase NudK n=1 Tax=Algoriphagus sp. A40 TaxID=1945863 RepID=UPI001C2C22E0|nr:GDP-mannose pyrophosphatase NudK [Algoriphagus sp. A40]
MSRLRVGLFSILISQTLPQSVITNVKILDTKILSDNWYILRKITYQYTKRNGEAMTQTREAYDRGNGATILLYHPEQKTVILTRQFRLPTFVNGNESGMLIEACAGLLDNENAEDCIKRETEEETGYKISKVRKIFEAYMSPGSVTEILHFFIAEYRNDMKVSEGGGAEDEEENIEVMEIAVDDALAMIDSGEIKDGKTILLLQYIKLHGIV